MWSQRAVWLLGLVAATVVLPLLQPTNRPYVQYVRLRFSINSQLSEQQDDAGLFPGRLSVLAGVPAADTRRRHRSPH